jgi:hypothetical protein
MQVVSGFVRWTLIDITMVCSSESPRVFVYLSSRNDPPFIRNSESRVQSGSSASRIVLLMRVTGLSGALATQAGARVGSESESSGPILLVNPQPSAHWSAFARLSSLSGLLYTPILRGAIVAGRG